jgi:hypothetical protein
MGAIFSYPLPKKHWLYAEREYLDGEVEPIELPKPILNRRADGDTIIAAVRYAIRAATNCGKELDFDPDALVLNAIYALCGPANQSPEHLPSAQPITEAMMDVVDRLGSEYDQVDSRAWDHMLVYAPKAPAAHEPFCFHDGRNVVDAEFRHDCDVFPLFTEPQPAKHPLSNEAIGLLTTDLRWSHIETPLLVEFAKAIEAAHGIK